MTEVFRAFCFLPDISMDDVESAVVLATLAAEAIHGRAQVRLNGRFEIDTKRREVRFPRDSEIGDSIASVLTVLASQMFGEDAFQVVDRKSKENTPCLT
jgi:hypothetical protein